MLPILLMISLGYRLSSCRSLIVEPTKLGVYEGQKAEFRCEVTETKNHIVKWIKRGSDWTKFTIELNRTDSTIATLIIPMTKRSNTGRYSCLVKHRKTEEIVARGNVKLDVFFLGNRIRLSPKNAQVSIGSNVTFFCQPPEGNPPVKIRWQKDWQNLNLSQDLHLWDKKSLTILNAQASDSGWYTCLAENKIGHRRETVRLTVYELPKFILRPTDKKVFVGENFTLECRRASMSMTLNWHKNDGNLPLRRYELVDGGNLAIFNAQPSDAGEYVCSICSPIEEISVEAKVEVIGSELNAL